MNYTEYLCRVDDAKQSETEAEFLRDYGYPSDDAETLVIWARIIFAVARNDWQELVTVAGEKFDGLKTPTNFGRYFDIPYQSLRQWLHKRREPPIYIIQLVGFALISDLPSEETEN